MNQYTLIVLVKKQQESEIDTVNYIKPMIVKTRAAFTETKPWEFYRVKESLKMATKMKLTNQTKDQSVEIRGSQTTGCMSTVNFISFLLESLSIKYSMQFIYLMYDFH